MKYHEKWSSFRITLLLYAIVLIIPLTFYFIYTSFDTMDKDTKIIRQVGWLDGSIRSFAMNAPDHNHQQMVKDIDETVQNISTWVIQNNNSKFYLGAQTLSQDLLAVTTCWNTYKQKLSTYNTNTAIEKPHLTCLDSVKNLTLIMENMVYLKQKDFINMFYWNLAVLMVITLLIIYFVRAYIRQQMKKHAIHDHETKLFNKTYFCAELKSSCARAMRNKTPLSVLSISIDDFGEESKHYSQKIQTYLLKTFGGLIISLVRESDVACRYNENHFFILLPETSEENALVLEKRISEALEKRDFGVIPELNFRFATSHLNYKETAEAFIERIETLLK
ncbi:GGDEF domain-containing protein [Sulfurovum sp. XGS-02]|uniref:GGDEF domain-containing protein n=1 Tax=Sulfurovum sp. XGS-02 TaxID=2925411 RepID=UPI00205BBA7D|nr:GGDEF domain-containing protein [Sulfurovum sp. XGS-02]UPT77310.1 GGDEF domain-containing protein [Sulfurovum sp. XGS-02]